MEGDEELRGVGLAVLVSIHASARKAASSLPERRKKGNVSIHASLLVIRVLWGIAAPAHQPHQNQSWPLSLPRRKGTHPVEEVYLNSQSLNQAYLPTN
jgi:hypothetical protein